MKITERIDQLTAESDKITAEIDASRYIREQLETEIGSLRTARTAASLRAKPND